MADPGKARGRGRRRPRGRDGRARCEGDRRGPVVPAPGHRDARWSTRRWRSSARRHDEVILGVLPDDEAAVAFLGAAGFAFHSTLWDLELPAGRPVASPAWPAGYRARPFDRAADVEALVDLFNAAFADHPTPLQIDVPGTAGAGWRTPASCAPRTRSSSRRRRRAGRVLCLGAQAPARGRRRAARRDLDDRRPPGPPGSRPGTGAPALGRRAPSRAGRRDRRAQRQRAQPAGAGPVRGRGLRARATRDRWARPVDPSPAG